MKKLTGTIVLGLALLVHIGVAVATEESYTFSADDLENAAALRVSDFPSQSNQVVFTGAVHGAGITHFGLFSIEE